MASWNGKIAVVTGAGAGIGLAIAEKLVKHGLKVVGVDRREEKLNELAKKLNGEKGKFITHKLDLTNTDDIIESFQWIAQNVGPISILVNNAGMIANTPISSGNIHDWKRTMDTNFFGLAVATRQALESMQANQIDGYIVNINSIAGHEVQNYPNLNVYPASKHAVTAFTETLRKELAAKKSKIRVTSVSPGLAATEIMEKAKNSDHAGLLNEIPLLLPEDVANAVWFVLETPSHVQVTELTIRPTGEMF